MASDSQLTEQQLFDQLISSLVHSAWVYMGKIKNPLNDKLEKNLDQATIQIDMLNMLYKRMSGNLTKNEDQYLGHLIRELKMNYIEEKNKKSEENRGDKAGDKKDGDEEKDHPTEDSAKTDHDEKNEEEE